MYKLNPFKNIISIENKQGEFVELGILGAVVAQVIYIVIHGIFSAVLYIPVENLTMLSVILTLSTIVCVVVVLNEYLPSYYRVHVKQDGIIEPTKQKVTIKNLMLLILVVIGFELSIEITLFPILLKNFEISNMITEFINRTKNMPLFFYAYVVIFGPMMEEIVCRGVILNGLSKRYSKEKAIVISALIFGVMHFNIIQFFNAFILGLILGWIYIKTESIILCMVMHCAHNLLSVICDSMLNLKVILPIKVAMIAIGAIIMFAALKKLASNVEDTKNVAI